MLNMLNKLDWQIFIRAIALSIFVKKSLRCRVESAEYWALGQPSSRNGNWHEPGGTCNPSV
ncbi:MAG: hypothetical protein F6K09_03695 [Merismopedia sp. SIO2A8]|nr:hypothetical protein [Merismopedia sp. SIO2A8]